MTAKNLLIVGHTPSPNTLRMREAVERGATHADISGVSVQALTPFDAGPDDVMAADGIILGTTENLGYMSGALKDFFDRTYYAVLEEKQGLPFGLYVRAGHDGTGTCRGVDTIVTGLRWNPIQEHLVCRGDWDEEFIDKCHELGMLMAAGLEAGIF